MIGRNVGIGALKQGNNTEKILFGPLMPTFLTHPLFYNKIHGRAGSTAREKVSRFFYGTNGL